MVVMQERVAVETADASSVASQATSPTIVLDKEEAERYRSAVAWDNYLSQDRLAIKYAVKELSR